MAKNGGRRPDRKMKPLILVLCEGQTEECYVNMLKQRYRIPIRIVSKIVGQKINQGLIDRYKEELKISRAENIECFLMYDADIKKIVDTLLSCEATALLSNPCIEVWFLAHTQRVPQNEISTDQCLALLRNKEDWSGYSKGALTESQKSILWKNKSIAKNNIEDGIRDNATFSTVGVFIERLEQE